jgi:DNA-directed RNA polymerase subunit M
MENFITFQYNSASMEFCPDCGSMMYLEEDVFECNDCDAVKLKEDVETHVSKEEGGRDEVTVLDEAEEKNLPKTDEPCPECENQEAYWYLQQTRAADEAETRFYICTECDNKWRGYD